MRLIGQYHGKAGANLSQVLKQSLQPHLLSRAVQVCRPEYPANTSSRAWTHHRWLFTIIAWRTFVSLLGAATCKRRYCLPSTQAHQRRLEPPEGVRCCRLSWAQGLLPTSIESFRWDCVPSMDVNESAEVGFVFGDPVRQRTRQRRNADLLAVRHGGSLVRVSSSCPVSSRRRGRSTMRRRPAIPYP